MVIPGKPVGEWEIKKREAKSINKVYVMKSIITVW